MPTLRCPNCGKVVRFEGVAGVCPGCASVVRAAAPVSDTPKSSSTGAARPKGRSAPLANLDGLDHGDPEVFHPGESGVHRPSQGFMTTLASLDPRLLWGGGAAIFFLLIFALYVLLRPATSDVALTPAPTISHTPAPDPSSSSDTQTPVAPPPVAQVIQSPVPPANKLQAASRPAWMTARPVVPTLAPPGISDKLVEQAIKKAIASVESQFVANGELASQDVTDKTAGKYALAVYALLQGGLAVNDSQLSTSDPYMQGLLDNLKHFSMNGEFATYCRSLRASAFSVFDRTADHQQLLADRDYLLKSELGGMYGYNNQNVANMAPNFGWDNSNCQYGVLGVWAGVQAGLAAPDKYWNDVEQHWLISQHNDGGWNYNSIGPNDSSSLTMTAAGVTTLCVTGEQLELIASKGKKDARPKMTQAIDKGLAFMGKGDTLLTRIDHSGYLLYGIERAALATGYRWFGDHDWYRELGAREIREQSADGSFGGIDGGSVETCFRLLFLSRGRQPLLMSKLRFDGDWNDRPRDVAKLTQFASAQLEKPFAWSVADLSRNWWDWLESPMLLISTDAPPDFSDEDCAKLRSYTDAGGFIFFHNEYASKDVDAYVNDLVKRVYPEYPMVKASPDNLIYSCDFPIKKKSELQLVGNGTRTFFVYSPKDVTQDWVRYRPKDTRENSDLQLGINLFVSAAGKSDFHNRLNSPYEPANDFAPLATIPVLQVTYPGAWNPEPKAYERFSRWFQNQTSLSLDVQPTSMLNLHPSTAPLAVLTGNQAVDFSKMDLHALQDFVQQGGILFIDSAGGNKDFAASVRESLLPTAFPTAHPTGIPFSDPILAGTGACMDALPKAHLRNYASQILNGVAPSVQYAAVGKGAIIVSDLDVTTGLLASGTYGIFGYTPAYCQSLMKNVVLWSLSRYSK